MKIQSIRLIILSFLLIITSVTAHAAVSDQQLHSYLFTTQDGLPNNTVRHIIQGRKGYLWFSTLNGISRYDGYSFINFRRDPSSPVTMNDQGVRNIFEDRNGLLWILGANDNVSCFDAKRCVFTDFNPAGFDRKYRYALEIGKYIWLWGPNGAMRLSYDGSSFTHTMFGRQAGNLPGDHVDHLGADHAGRIWMSSDNKIYVLRGDTPVKVLDDGPFQWVIPVSPTSSLIITARGNIYRIDGNGMPVLKATVPNVTNTNQLPGNFVSHGKWYVFSIGGAHVFDLKTNKLSAIDGPLNMPGSKVLTDNQGDFWLHNETGMIRYINSATGSTLSLELIPRHMAGLLDMERFEVARDRRGNAWISTNGNGLFKYDFATNTLSHFSESDGNTRTVPSNDLLYVMVDRSGTVWFGSEYTGAGCIEETPMRTPLTLPGTTHINQMSNSFRMVKRLQGGDIAIATRDGRVVRYAPDLCTVRSSQLLKSPVYDAVTDAAGHLWLATRGGGIWVDNRNYTYNAADPASLPGAAAFALCRDKRGRMWIGTLGGGLALAVPSADGTLKFRNFFNDNTMRRRVRVLTLDANGNMWMGSNDGLTVFNPDRLIANDSDFTVYNLEKNNFKTDMVHCITACRDGSKPAMWIGSDGAGIAVCRDIKDIKNLKFEYIAPEDGLVNGAVTSLTPIRGQIVAATEYGLSRMDMQGRILENYILSTEPKSNVYPPNSALALNDSLLLIGSHSGIFNFNPFAVRDTPGKLPEVRFTGHRINGKSQDSANDPESLGVAYTDNLRLSSKENNIEIDFSTLEFSREDAATYSYRLVPYDKDWSHPSPLNYAAYKNLPAGDYILYVRAARKDGKWGPESSLRIKVDAPWYATWWSRTIAILLSLAAIVIVFMVMRRMQSLRNRVEVEQQLTDYKLDFFTNISHEFRTPLTLMQVSLEKIHETLNAPGARDSRRLLSGHLTTLDKNSRRMSRLINELLTFRKVEKNKLTLLPRPTEVVAFLTDIFETFSEEARQKQLSYTMHCDMQSLTMNVDRDSLDKIAHNLLSNAVKYTLQDGSVEFHLSVDTQRQMLVLCVRDTGIGIAADKKALLFSRFMQSNFSNTSIGVGLNLIHGLVQLYGGSIRHEDNPGGGSVFTVEIPTTLQAADVPEADTVIAPEPVTATAPQMLWTDSDDDSEPEQPETGLKLLIIDDDADIREVLNREFSQYFDVITAADGTSGLKAARENDISLIICDVMMPDMTGFEVTRRLKDDIATSHIPIIQLTALSNDDAQMKGIRTGADAYMTKPFSLQMLKARVFKLIELRKMLRAKFSQTPEMPSPELAMVAHDREFYDRIVEVINEQMDNPDFSADDFAASLNMGRTIFFKKVKGVTGYGPKEFLRIMRMKRGAELLLTTDLTISEIAYKVGLSDPAYFNRCFKTQFGKAPSVYQKENRGSAAPQPDSKNAES